MLYAVTGVIASGKSTVLDMFKNKGYKVISADKVYHELLRKKSVVKMLVKEFGEEILTDEIIDRKKLGKIVFHDKYKLEKLNSLTHPLIIRKILSMVNANQGKKIFVEAPLLFESGMDKYFKKILYITAKDEICIKRLMERNGLFQDEATERVAMSKRAKEENIDFCTYILRNDGNLEELEDKVNTFLAEI